MAKSAKKTAQPTHAFDFLQSQSALPGGISVVFGTQRFLRGLVRQQLLQQHGIDSDEDFATSRFDDQVELATVLDELQTQSLFGGGRDKLVFISDADDFVKRNREALEKLTARQGMKGSLILEVDNWLLTTRLSLALDGRGLQIDCELPVIRKGKNTYTDENKIRAWVNHYAQSTYGLTLNTEATKLLCDFTDHELGRIDSELSKLTLYLSAGEKVTGEHVKQYVGGWRRQSMFDAAEATMAGDTRQALLLVDRLIKSGEHPVALLAQLAGSLRRYPKAMEIYDRMKRRGTKPRVREAIERAGFPKWDSVINQAESNMRRIGRDKMESLNQLLLQTDLSLKGSHSREDRARLAVEKLIVWLAIGDESRANPS